MFWQQPSLPFLPALDFKELYQSYFQANYITPVLLDYFNVFLKMKIIQPARSWIQILHLLTAPTSISSFILWSNTSSRNVHYPSFFIKLILLFVFFEVWSRRSIYMFNIFNFSVQAWRNIQVSSLRGHTTLWRIWQCNVVSQPEILAQDDIFHIHYKIEQWLRCTLFKFLVHSLFLPTFLQHKQKFYLQLQHISFAVYFL